MLSRLEHTRKYPSGVESTIDEKKAKPYIFYDYQLLCSDNDIIRLVFYLMYTYR
jgi:hypothetical protein